MLMRRVRGLKSSCGILQFLVFPSLPVILFSAHHLCKTGLLCDVHFYLACTCKKVCTHTYTCKHLGMSMYIIEKVCASLLW